MDSNRKSGIIRSLLIFGGGLIGIFFYLIFPFDRQFFGYKVAIIMSIVICITGVIILLINFTKTLPIIRSIPAFIPLFCFIGTFTLIFFIINPFLFPVFFETGLLSWIVGGYYLWLYIKERQTKKL